ncbi:hypothetical protein IKM56_03415 [Candidatus Saccharibacteria bacterium]|nr:hypothetical protein [Candidatus Saccharibacteria bacterium]
MKKNEKNTDFLDTMELPVIRPRPTSKSKIEYDGSYDRHNDPYEAISRRVEAEAKRLKIAKTTQKAKQATIKRAKASSSSRYGETKVYSDEAPLDARAIVSIIMALILIAIFAIVFMVIMTQTRKGRESDPSGPSLPAFVVSETTEATTSATTEAQTTETTTETTTSAATEATTETTIPTTEATTQTTEAQMTEAIVTEVQVTEATELEIIVTDPPMPTEATTEPAIETTLEPPPPADVEDLDPDTPGIQGAW